MRIEKRRIMMHRMKIGNLRMCVLFREINNLFIFVLLGLTFVIDCLFQCTSKKFNFIQ